MSMTMKLPTLAERELLMTSYQPFSSGFLPRPSQKLAVQKKPHNMLDIECKHYLRCPSSESVHGHSSVQHRLWMEAGKYDAPFPEKPDPNYNSNVWRNFRKQYGFDVKTDGRTISEVIATMYPLNIPAPSRVGENTFAKYITETKLFRNEKFKALAVQRTSTDIKEFRQLRVRSEARNPPLDEQGQILPPENFKKYHHRFIPVNLTEPEGSGDEVRVDMFGQKTKPAVKTGPYLWKLTSKLSSPEYGKVSQEVERRKAEHKKKMVTFKPLQRSLPVQMVVNK